MHYNIYIMHTDGMRNNVMASAFKHGVFACQLTPRSDYPPSRGGSQERAYLFYDRPSTLYSQIYAPTFRGQSRLSGFDCVLDHCATTFGACAHSMKTAVRYQLRTQGRSPLQILPPNPSPFRIILKVKSTEHKSISEIHDILNWDTLENRCTKHI